MKFKKFMNVFISTRLASQPGIQQTPQTGVDSREETKKLDSLCQTYTEEPTLEM